MDSKSSSAMTVPLTNGSFITCSFPPYIIAPSSLRVFDRINSRRKRSRPVVCDGGVSPPNCLGWGERFAGFRDTDGLVTTTNVGRSSEEANRGNPESAGGSVLRWGRHGKEERGEKFRQLPNPLMFKKKHHIRRKM
jgi:hypothetical protein